MVFPSKNGWYSFHAIPFPPNQFHGLVIFPLDLLFCMSRCTERKDDYGRAGFDFCVAFLLMRAVLAAASLKGDSDRIVLPDVGTTLVRVSFRTFRNRKAVIGKPELCQDPARLSATKTCRKQSDVLIRNQFLTCESTVSNPCLRLFICFRGFKSFTEIIHIAARADIILIIRDYGTVFINFFRGVRRITAVLFAGIYPIGGIKVSWFCREEASMPSPLPLGMLCPS